MRKRAINVKTIGTRDGHIHSDEALACYMLKVLPEYKDARYYTLNRNEPPSTAQYYSISPSSSPLSLPLCLSLSPPPLSRIQINIISYAPYFPILQFA